MQETMRKDTYKDMKYYYWNVTTDEKEKTKPIRQLNSSQLLNTFYKFNINERYFVYEMKCQEMQQTLNKEIKFKPKSQHFNSWLRREYQIEKIYINCDKLNEEYKSTTDIKF
jgi:hypothetical protein